MGRAEPDVRPPGAAIRVESQLRYSKFLSQQWQLVNDSEKNHLAYGLASAYSIRAARVDQYARCRAKIQSPEKCALRWVNTHVNNFFVCGPKFKNFS